MAAVDALLLTLAVGFGVVLGLVIAWQIGEG